MAKTKNVERQKLSAPFAATDAGDKISKRKSVSTETTSRTAALAADAWSARAAATARPSGTATLAAKTTADPAAPTATVVWSAGPAATARPQGAITRTTETATPAEAKPGKPRTSAIAACKTRESTKLL